jgi:hypothetical protein
VKERAAATNQNQPTSGQVGERRSAWKSWAGEVEAEEARTQSTTAGTASAGRARKQLSRAATARSGGDAMAEPEAEADGRSPAGDKERGREGDNQNPTLLQREKEGGVSGP